MRLKFLSLIAAAALVTACSSTPEQGAGAGGQGGAQEAAAEKLGPKAGTAQDFVVNVGDRVFFALDKYDLGADAQATLKGQAAWLMNYPTATIQIEGHADERGTREYNLALGERRANSARDYLIALGVPGERVKTISYGKERPVALGHNEAAWAQNRRAVSVITGGAGS